MQGSAELTPSGGTHRNVLLTGASAGIGLALAEGLLARGDRVFALQRRPSPLAGAPRFAEVACDLGEHAGIEPRIAHLLAGVERLDLVVLNAAISSRIADLADTPLAEIQRVMDVNAWANKLLLDAVFARGVRVDQVVGVSSGAAVNGSRGWSGYALSKAAFVMLLALYAAERPETHFCSLAPGIVQTRMQDDLNAATPEELEKFPALKRLAAARGTPDMPRPELAAPRLLDAFERARREPSGAFVSLKSLGLG
jgi:NAD(P)-dependent dehydrogenase (short-subunit alcohol dehydrogenase family)